MQLGLSAMLLSRCHRAVFETPIHAFSPLFSPALHEGSSDKLETVWEMVQWSDGFVLKLGNLRLSVRVFEGSWAADGWSILL